jgi:uncharacterized protein YdaU (DUF1376 family)
LEKGGMKDSVLFNTRAKAPNLEAHGLYVTLAFACCLRGPLPDDNAEIAKIAGCNVAAIERYREILLGQFFEITNGRWQPRPTVARIVKGKKR